MRDGNLPPFYALRSPKYPAKASVTFGKLEDFQQTLTGSSLEVSSSFTSRQSLLSPSEFHCVGTNQILSDGLYSEHIEAICNVSAWQESVECIRLGDSEKRTGGAIHDGAIGSLITGFPHLQYLHLNSATSITDAAFHSIVDNCPQLRILAINGNFVQDGALSRNVLHYLATNDKSAPKLMRLEFLDQDHVPFPANREAARKLSLARRNLEVTIGSTIGTGSQLAGSEIGVPQLTYKNGKIVANDAHLGPYGIDGTQVFAGMHTRESKSNWSFEDMHRALI